MVIQVLYPAVTNDLQLTRLKTDGDDPYDTFDVLGRVEDHLWKTNVDIDQFSYGYDRNSNRKWRDNTKAGVDGTKDERYLYDGLDRLTTFHRGKLDGNENITSGANRERGQHWTLTQTGNWKGFQLDADGDGDYTEANTEEVDQERAHNIVNEIDTDNTHGDADTPITQGANQPDWKDPIYDAAGNMTRCPKAGYGTDTDTEETPLLFVYDAWGRLVAVWNDDNNNGVVNGGENPDDTFVAEYRYDGLNRRIVKLVPKTFDGKNVTEWSRTDYHYTASWQVIEERYEDRQANKETLAADAKFQYVWGVRYIDAAILRDEDKNSDGDCTDDDPDDERLYYCQDANFNVTALVKDGTPATVEERYVYDAYGKATIYNVGWTATIAWVDSKKNEILYCGYRLDPETGMYHVRNRYYHPTLGLWPQRDPSGYVDGMNLYEYVRSRPLNGTDPTGKLFWLSGCSSSTSPPTVSTENKTKAKSFKVSCKGQEIGNLEFDTFEAFGDAESGGVDITGGFVKKAGVDYKEGKCCCKELRWVQAIGTNLQKNTATKTLSWGSPSDTYIDARGKEPFYFLTTGDSAESVAAWQPIGKYELGFHDNPRRTWDIMSHKHSVIFWSAQLCLTCVRSRGSKGGGRVEILKCVRYYFSASRYSVTDDWDIIEDRKVVVNLVDGVKTMSSFNNAMRNYGHGWTFENFY